MTRDWLTTAEAAKQIGLPTRYIYDEAMGGRLEAQIVDRPPRQGRTRGARSIRIYPAQWSAYVARYFPERREGVS